MSQCASVSISSNFDSGNIIRVNDGEFGEIRLEIKPDIYTELEKKTHSQWFYFRCVAQKTESTQFEIVNAGKTSFGAGSFPGFTVCFSHDRKTWRRIQNTEYDQERGVLKWSYDWSQAVTKTAYFAYFAPYTYEQHLDLIHRCQLAEGVSHRSLGLTLDGRDIDCLRVGTGPLQAWVIHRQHPGETQASYFAEGFLARLLGLDDDDSGVDGLVARLRKNFTFHIVPNMNPDGSVRGHLRTNACGANLNREWTSSGDYKAPSKERSPEVFYTLQAMDATGVDFFIDVHGDEALPYNFLAGSEGVAHWGPRLKGLHGAFLQAFCRANPDMQSAFSYEPDKPNGANLTVCSNQIAHRFNCLSSTLEMPFKDLLTNPDPKRGWTPARCKKLGASLLDAITYVQPFLRSSEPFWESLPATDAYAAPREPTLATNFV